MWQKPSRREGGAGSLFARKRVLVRRFHLEAGHEFEVAEGRSGNSEPRPRCRVACRPGGHHVVGRARACGRVEPFGLQRVREHGLREAVKRRDARLRRRAGAGGGAGGARRRGARTRAGGIAARRSTPHGTKREGIMRWLVLPLLLCLPATSGAQPIQADRPGVSEPPYVVPRGTGQIEAGVTFGRETDGGHVYTWLVPEPLLRVGVFERAELRLSGDGGRRGHRG